MSSPRSLASAPDHRRQAPAELAIRRRPEPRDLVLAALLAFAALLGGGGSPAPLPEMVLEWLALAALVAYAWLSPPGAVPRAAVGFALAVLALPLLQLLPLPPRLWQALPGRESEAAALAVIGRAAAWMPWSVSPPRTLAALLALVPPLVVMLLTAGASPRGRTLGLATVVAMALASVVLGAAQLAGGPASPLRLYPSQAERLVGFQANRNAAADVLIVGLLAVAALLRMHRSAHLKERSMLAAGAAVLLSLAVLLTGSRTGIALLAAVLVGIGLWLSRGRWVQIGAKRLVIGGAAAISLCGLGAWAVASNPTLSATFGRFGSTDDPRSELWRDTLYAAGQHWPWGSGLGTFVPVFIASEPLEVVDASSPNRAHNDYLELALEAGLPGLLLLAGLAGWIAWRLIRRLRTSARSEERGQLVFAAATLACLGLHSVVDYPLRSMALASLAGFAAGIVLVPGAGPGRLGWRARGDGRDRK